MSKRAPYPLQHENDLPLAWKSLEERARLGDPELLKERAQEFPRGHFTTPPSDQALSLGRRGFLGAVGATFALAGAEGCRRPVEHVVPYAKMPENVIPGIPSHYATAYVRRGDTLGLIVESHEGRPTKVEGNPEHPSSLGAADLLTQAAILDLYDPDRAPSPVKMKNDATWDDFDREMKDKLAAHEKTQGAGLRVLMEPTRSPTAIRLRGQLMARFPKAHVHTWAPVNDSNVREGARLAFGQPVQPVYAYDRAGVVLALDSDFLQTETGSVRATKLFSAGRRLRGPTDTMNRLYVVEPQFTTTGTNADHRLRLPASDVAGYLVALIAELSKKVYIGPVGTRAQGIAPPASVPAKWISAVAQDLNQHRGRSILVVGSRQPPIVHAMAHALNHALGNVGSTVQYVPVADPDEKDNATDLGALVDAMKAGQVDTLFILGGNPVYDAPSGAAFADALTRVQTSVHLASLADETSDKTTWHLPRAHEFEAWGDQKSLDGTVSIQQPLILPLFGGRSDVEMLAMLAAAPEPNALAMVRATTRDALLGARGLADCGPAAEGKTECHDVANNLVPFDLGELDRDWKKALRDGMIARPPTPPVQVVVRIDDIATKLPAPAASPSKDNLEVTFAPCPKVHDGRHLNNPWVLELPDPLTKIVWDNVAILSPATARELGVASKDMISLTVGSKSIAIAAWVFPGQADNTVALTLGWGRTKAGRLGTGQGFDVYPLRASGEGFALGAKVAKTGNDYFVSQTQDHDSMEGRALIRDASYAEYTKTPDFAEKQSPPPRALPLWSDQDYSKGHQWGMSIDLNACTGCNACIIACQSENNVPVVGKREVWRGREMSWIRLDRYFVEDERHGSTADDPVVAQQPVMCVQCEDAPCENVCPVNATTHSPEGLNDMAYNRCIGTRYCANNCPYKVRRFNFLNWHNDAVFKETDGVPETMQMQFNPNVTVRFRGVMEKCTYCVQRIQSVKIQSLREAREIKDGEIRTACQQTCPADAIVFGDLNDLGTKVSRLARSDRQYRLLAEIGTKPRTTYLGKVRNTNPDMLGAPAGAAEKEHG